MIGTTLKLGFDGTSVARGLSSVGKLVGNFGRQIAIGGARQIGARMTDTLGRALSYIPDMLGNTLDWAGEVNDMANQTGIAAERFIQLQEALRLSGAEGADTSRMISMMAKNIQEAAANGGPAAEALQKIGLRAQDLKNLNVDEMFYTIGRRIAELNKTTVTPFTMWNNDANAFTEHTVETTESLENMESIMSDIFGGKMGFKLIRFFKDFDGSMAQARRNVGGLASAMSGGMLGRMDDFGDALGRWETLKRSLSTIALDEFFRFSGGAGGVNAMFDKWDPEKLRGPIQDFTSMIGRNLEVVLTQGLGASLGDVMRNLGKSFGEGIRDAIQIDVKSFLPKWLGGGSGQTTQASDPALKQTNNLLSDIRREVGGPARFA